MMYVCWEQSGEFVIPVWDVRRNKHSYILLLNISDLHLHVINICIYIYEYTPTALGYMNIYRYVFFGRTLGIIYIFLLPVMFVSFLTETFRVVKSVNALV